MLALDTATGSLGAAVLDDGRVLAEVTHQDSRRHGELLAPAMDQALATAGVRVADLSAVAVGVGPGPFTGLRVGVVTGLVLGQVRGIPVHGICSLDALAEQAVAEQVVDGPFLVATDARRKEVYWAQFAVANGVAHRTGGPDVARAADLPASVRALPAVGQGPLLYDVLTRAADDAPTDVAPGWIGIVAHRALTAGADQDATPGHGILLPPEPLYLRRPDATEPGPPKVAS
nr:MULTISPECIES: tRNA (adenosine(37)-N6)-threonylcarbamoyltransferase complex dimerization subunit type 1 TsaB [unclassified Ornithinimicrobium]